MKVELIEKAAAIVGDNQLLVNIVSKRVQQLNHGADPFVPTEPETGTGDIALMEIIQGKLTWREMTDEEIAAAAAAASQATESAAPAPPPAAPEPMEATVTLSL